MKRLILTNSEGGISINVDIEVVPPCICRVYLLTQLHEASLLWRHTYSFWGQVHFVSQIALGQVIVRYFTGPQDGETERLG